MTSVPVGVGVTVAVWVGVTVVPVGVGVGTDVVFTTNWGALAPDSRLARLIAVPLDVLAARLSRPFVLTNDVTPISTQLLALTAAEVLTTPDMAGAFA